MRKRPQEMFVLPHMPYMRRLWRQNMYLQGIFGMYRPGLRRFQLCSWCNPCDWCLMFVLPRMQYMLLRQLQNIFHLHKNYNLYDRLYKFPRGI